jgi:ribosomal protein L27
MSRIPEPVREALKDRAAAEYDGEVALCEICGKLRGSNAHHRRNQSQGGRHTLANLMWICGSGTTGCHGWIGGNIAAAKRMGWTIQGTEFQPDEVAVWRRDEKVFLLEDGTVMPLDWDGEAA